MVNKNVGKKYNDDFKKMVVNLHHSGKSVKELSDEFGISDVTIYHWIKKFSPIQLEDATTTTSDDFAKLQKQLLRLQEENDILKKAMAIFARK